LDNHRLCGVLLALCLVLALPAWAATTRHDDFETGLAIGRSEAMLDQIATMLGMPEEDGTGTQEPETLRQLVRRYIEELPVACDGYRIEASICIGSYEPSWLQTSDSGWPEPLLRSRAEEILDRVTSLWSSLCRERAAHTADNRPDSNALCHIE
jgi:hypothetical protein